MSQFIETILNSFERVYDLKNFVVLFPGLSLHHIIKIETVANDRKLDFLDQKLIRVAFLRGNKEAETLYKDGRLHRLTEWFPNGTKAAEVEYFEGDRRRYRGYWENGNLNEDVHYMNGEIEGSFTNWYPDGTLNSSGSYHNGLKEGIWTFWHTTLEFHNDILIS